jgi:hypothetical protein
MTWSITNDGEEWGPHPADAPLDELLPVQHLRLGGARDGRRISMSFHGAWATWTCRKHSVQLGPRGYGDPTECFQENCVGDALYNNGMDTARLHQVLGKGGWYEPSTKDDPEK